MTVHKLNQKQIIKIFSLAKSRNAKAVKFGSRGFGNKYRKNSSFYAHFIGLIGEFAVANLYNLQINEEIFDDHGDEGFDLIVPKIGKIDVKTTTYFKDPYLRIPIKEYEKNKDIKAYFLVAVDEINFNYQIIGWILKDEVAKFEQKQLCDNGPMNYIITKDKLTKIQNEGK